MKRSARESRRKFPKASDVSAAAATAIQSSDITQEDAATIPTFWICAVNAICTAVTAATRETYRLNREFAELRKMTAIGEVKK